MARPRIEIEPSPYYPRRARWYSSVLYPNRGWFRGSRLDDLRLPHEMKLGQLAAGLVIPGLAVYFRGPRLWGRAALGASAALALAFIVWLGYPAANLAFGMMISIHTTGLVYYCNPMIRDWPSPGRLGFTVLILLAVGLSIYMPARNYVQGHWVTPLLLEGRVIVVQKAFAVHNIRRGDWVAYELQGNRSGDAHNGGAVQVEQGMMLGPVLAVAGDQVTFATNSFAVNGVVRPGLPHMPDSGELIVPANCWFIWPNLNIRGHGNVGPANITSTMLNLASVDETQLFGKPLHRWFWRRQVFTMNHVI